MRGPAAPIPHTGDREARIAALAGRQHDLVTIAQLAELGLSARAAQDRVVARRWRRVHRGVFTVSHAPLSRDARRLAAVLAAGPGAALSHRAAAAAWGLLAEPRCLDVVTPTARGTATLTGVRLRRTRSLPPDDVTVLRGVPITNEARTLVDLASVVPPAVLDHAVHEADVARVLDRAAVSAASRRRPGLRGGGTLRALVELPARDPDPETFVAAFLRLCARHGLPEPEVDDHVSAGFPWLTQLDLVYPAARLVVELDGERTHLTRRRFHTDRRRDTAMAARGWMTLRLTWHRVTREGAQVAAELKSVLAHRGVA